LTDPRYDKISELFVNYSNGNFDYRVDISERMDEIDAFISSINMLGEELKDITISREFFNNVFNSVSDLIFVLDIEGNITLANKAVKFKIGFEEDELTGVNIDILFANGRQ
jgi:PAS domain-containing protein